MNEDTRTNTEADAGAWERERAEDAGERDQWDDERADAAGDWW